jgi:hypothetical protein
VAADPKDKDKSDFTDKLKALAGRFWWLRGAAAAVTLSAVVPNFIELGRFQYLLGIHLLIVAWSEVASRIGTLVGRLPFVPPLSSEVVSSFVFALSIALPASAAFAISQLHEPHQAQAEQEKSAKQTASPRSWLASVLASLIKKMDRMHVYEVFVILVALAIFLLGWYSYHELSRSDFAKVSTEHHYETVRLPSFVDEKGQPAEVTIRRTEKVTRKTTPLGSIAFIGFVGGLFAYALYAIRGVRRGVVFVMTFFLVSEVLYLISAPRLTDEICELARHELSDVPKACVEKPQGE